MCHKGPTSLPPPRAQLAGLSPPHGTSGLLPKLLVFLLVQEKLIQSFFSIWTLFDIDFLKSKKQAKNGKWHWALG
jgi:hypothetical protein